MNEAECRRKLYRMWQYARRCKKKENVIICDRWGFFEGFYNDNLKRYRRALKKWSGYKKTTTPRKGQSMELSNSPVRFVRRKKINGFTLKNTLFTSPSDYMKFFDYTHKYIFENKLLGTRDILNILKKRGIRISMEMLTERLRNGRNLFEPNKYAKFLHKSKYRTILEVSNYENVKYTTLLSRLRIYGSMAKAIKSIK